MKRLILLSIAVLFGPSLAAQSGSITPIVRADETQVKIKRFGFDTNGPSPNTAVIEISVQTAAAVETRYFNVAVPGSSPCTATTAGLATAMITVRATETGADGRKIQFRIIGYLSDQGCLPGVTPIP